MLYPIIISAEINIKESGGMESTIVGNSDGETISELLAIIKYRYALRKQLDDEVKKIIDAEMQQATDVREKSVQLPLDTHRRTFMNLRVGSCTRSNIVILHQAPEIFSILRPLVKSNIWKGLQSKGRITKFTFYPPYGKSISTGFSLAAF
jgi:hypothetical protein